MNTNPNNYFIRIEQAREKIAQLIKPIQGFEQVDLMQALNRVLDETVQARFATPPFDNSAMDGYALRRHDQDRYTLCDTSFAGHPSDYELQPGECVRIMTGAQIPPNCDAVVMQEYTEKVDEQTILVKKAPKAGENIRYTGEDLNPGDTVIACGKRLSPSDLAYLASQGVGEVRVKRRPRVAFFSTGDELCALNQPLGAGQIYDANRYALYGMLKQAGVEILDMGIIRDQREAIEEAFAQAVANADVLITSGGVSVGDADYVTQTLQKLGQIDFWKIAMKPGKPLAFGTLGDCLFIGLPGNPVSSITTFYQIALGALKQLSGEQTDQPLLVPAVADEDLKKAPGRVDFQRGICFTDEHGTLRVKSAGTQGSHILTAMSRANCYLVLEKDRGAVSRGERVSVQPFYGLLA